MHQYGGMQRGPRRPAQFAPSDPLQLVVELGETAAIGLAAIGQWSWTSGWDVVQAGSGARFAGAGHPSMTRTGLQAMWSGGPDRG